MITASLYDFLLSGRLGDLHCEMEESEVIRLIGIPDDTMKHATTYHGYYGCLHIQYANTKQVVVLSIQVDYPSFPNVAPSVSIDPWQIRQGMSPEEFAEVMSNSSADFVECPVSGKGRIYRVNECTEASFHLDSNGIYALSLLASFDPSRLPD